MILMDETTVYVHHIFWTCFLLVLGYMYFIMILMNETTVNIHHIKTHFLLVLDYVYFIMILMNETVYIHHNYSDSFPTCSRLRVVSL